MENMSSLLDLVLVQGAAEFDVLNGRVLLAVKFLLPSWFVSKYGLIELLKMLKYVHDRDPIRRYGASSRLLLHAWRL